MVQPDVQAQPSRRGRKLERYQNSIWFHDLLQIVHPRCVELLEISLDLWRPRVPTGSRCTSLTRQEICQICPISGLNRWRPCWEMQKEPSSAWGYPELCSMRISIDIYRILWTMVFFPWLCEPKSKCCPFHVSTLASSHHGSPGVVPCSSARWRRRRAAGHLNLHTIVKAPENEIAKLVPMTISLWYTHIDR